MSFKQEFHSSLEKSAEKAQKKRKKNKDTIVDKAGRFMGGNIIAGTVQKVQVNGLGSLMNTMLDKDLMKPEEIQKIIQDYNTKNPNAKVTHEALAGLEDLKFMGKKRLAMSPAQINIIDNHVMLPSDAPEAIVRHELGHADNYKMIKGKNARVAVAVARNLGAAGGALASAFQLISGDEQTQADSWKTTAYGSIPTYLDEGIASLRAAKDLIKSHGFKSGLKKSMVLLPAFGTYLAPLAGAYAAAKVIGGSPEKKEELKKTANIIGLAKVQ